MNEKGDLIGRTEVINAIDEREDVNGNVNAEDIRTDICLIPSKSDKGEWIPIEVRPSTEEEKEYYTEHEYPVDFMMMYDCPMPDDGQEVLITTSTGYVTTDTYYIDEGGYFENYCDEGDVKAWMPKPEPYKKGE